MSLQLFKPEHAPVHGGRLNAAAQQSDIPLEQWLDLSTGINPNGWPVPPIPEHVFTRLPEDDDELNHAAQQYYQADPLLAVAGSQAAIQMLPQLRASCKVGIINPGYQEHAYCWHAAGHEVYQVSSDEIENAIDSLDVLVLINPNNPTGEIYSKEQLLEWHKRLAKKDGWLIVDEAFMDSETGNSLLQESPQTGLIVLRSLGKFFGLAGLRVGFVFTDNELLDTLSQRLGPWTLSHPARFVATLALQDSDWQRETRQSLAEQSNKLIRLLSEHDLTPNGGTHLFQWVRHDNAIRWHKALAQQGILVRHFEQTNSLRFGLPKNDYEFERLESAISRTKDILVGMHYA